MEFRSLALWADEKKSASDLNSTRANFLDEESVMGVAIAEPTSSRRDCISFNCSSGKQEEEEGEKIPTLN